MSIEVKGLTKAYGKAYVFRDLTISFPDGVTTVIMGASGCGKTTLARILLGLETADAGGVTGMPDKTAVVFQEDRLCTDFSAYENITLVLDTKKMDRQALWETVSREAAQVGITEAHLRQNVEELSGGMKRRIALLRAVLYDADCMILDEAFQGLDAETKQRTIAYVKERTAGKTCIVITHNEDEAEQFDGTICMPFSNLPKS